MALQNLSIIVAEDKKGNQDEIIRALKEEYGNNLDVASAVNVHELIQKLRDHFQQGHPFDVVILDYWLPDDNLSADSAQPRLWYEINRYGVGLTVYISARADEAIRKEIIRIQGEYESKVSDVINKKEMGWTYMISKEVRRYAAEQPIREALNDLFGWSTESRGSERYRRINTDDKYQSGTHRLAKLKLEIKENWSDLSEGLQRRIHDLLGINIEEDQED